MTKKLIFTEILDKCLSPCSVRLKPKDIKFGDVFEVVGRSEPHKDWDYLIELRRIERGK